MSDQETAFSSAYGEAMFNGHLIEDLLALLIFECTYFHVNGYPGLTARQIRELTHAERIDELAKIYQNPKTGGMAQVISVSYESFFLSFRISTHLAPEAAIPTPVREFRSR